MHIIQYDCTAIGDRYVARLQPKLGSGGTLATLGGELDVLTTDVGDGVVR